ncbi:MAG: hypothetical protein U1E16_09325 [Hyphomicrobiales bacterium]
MAGPALSQQVEYTYTPNDGRLLASNCFQCHGVNGANSKAFEGLAGKNDVYKELLEMNQSSGTEREEELMAVHAKAFSKMGGVNGANGPQIEMKLIADYLASQNSGGGGGDGDHHDTPKSYSLLLTKTNPAFGSVSGKVSCNTRCTAASKSFKTGSTIKLRAKPARGHKFIGWSGDCAGSSRSCTVKMTSTKSVRAIFE